MPYTVSIVVPVCLANSLNRLTAYLIRLFVKERQICLQVPIIRRLLTEVRPPLLRLTTVSEPYGRL